MKREITLTELHDKLTSGLGLIEVHDENDCDVHAEALTLIGPDAEQATPEFLAKLQRLRDLIVELDEDFHDLWDCR